MTLFGAFSSNTPPGILQKPYCRQAPRSLSGIDSRIGRAVRPEWLKRLVERGMKCFLSDDLDQSLLMPPSLHDWLPENHLARFVGFGGNAGSLGILPILPGESGVPSGDDGAVVDTAPEWSARIEKRTYEDVASADSHPDHSTVSEFRKRHLGALAGLFVQALRLCQKAGLHVAVEVQGNASKHKAMSYDGCMNPRRS